MSVTIRFSTFVQFFLISIVLGSGVGYGHLYLFHIALMILFLSWLFFSFYGRSACIVKPRSCYFYFFVCMICWYSLSLVWSIAPLYTLRYLVYIALGFSVVFVVTVWSKNEERYQSIFNIIKWVFILEICIALLESFTPFRMPTSPYSEFAYVFNRKGTDFDIFSDDVISLIKSAPTGFLGNPNNLAVVMVTILPFFLFDKRLMVKLLGLSAILVIVVSTGSRGAFIALLFGVIVYFFVKNKFFFIAISVFAILVFSTLSMSIEPLKNSGNKRIAEMAYAGDVLLAFLMDSDDSGGSISVRKQLILNGLNALKQTNGLGVGGGGSQAVQERLGGVNGKITSMHNFWIEILVDAGVLFFLFFVIWYVLISLELYFIYKRTKNVFYRYHSGALLVSFATFSVGCISASSTIYLLPMWLMFGLAIALISLNKKNQLRLVSNE